MNLVTNIYGRFNEKDIVILKVTFLWTLIGLAAAYATDLGLFIVLFCMSAGFIAGQIAVAGSKEEVSE